jgi:predicted TIM-barrel fold metal-dependent hydrolase
MSHAAVSRHPDHNDPPLIAGPVPNPRRPALPPPSGAWDTHAHVFGPAGKFPFAPGRGYTPPPAPAEKYIALLDRLGFARGVIVQGNAHGYDNSVVLDALDRQGPRVRGVAITDTRVAPATLRDWHRRGMRGLRFHVFSDAGRPGYVRGVGLDVFETFRPVMRELGWVMQVWCDWRVLPDLGDKLREIAAELPVVIDHMLNIPAVRGTATPRSRRSFASSAKVTCTRSCRRPIACPRRFPTIPTRVTSTTRSCAPIPNA